MPIRLCVNTQTPLVRFSPGYDQGDERAGPRSLSDLTENRDYQFTPGGVTRMVFPLLKRMLGEGMIQNPHWVTLNPVGPEEIVADGITFCHVRMREKVMKGYGHIKEDMWRTIHGIVKGLRPHAWPLWEKEYADYTYYNRISSEHLLALDKELDFDVFYIHDFQQLPVGHMLGSLKPKVFRWHIPFDDTVIPADWRSFLLTYFNAYDLVLVSCRKYLDALRKFGFRGNVRYIYPYIDQGDYRRPTPGELEAFCARFGLREQDRVVLVVARMDPMKGQDLAIKAFARAARTVPGLKLVLAGNGSFSSSSRGIGLSKGADWLRKLKHLVKRLKLEDRVVFTGHIDQRELQAAYERCEITLLPSLMEGFGLVVIESWLYKKAAVVSSRAGVADLVVDGENGYLADPTDLDAFAKKIVTLLKDPDLTARLGEGGFETSKKGTLDEGTKNESEMLRDLLGGKIVKGDENAV